MSRQHTRLVNLSTDLKRLQDMSSPFKKQKLNHSPYTVTAGYGKCTACSCPGFSGSGYTCNRGGCKHHYDQHW